MALSDQQSKLKINKTNPRGRHLKSPVSVTKNRIIDQTVNDFTKNTYSNSNKEDDKIYIFSKPHNDMYITAYRIFLDNKLLGVGPRQFI